MSWETYKEAVLDEIGRTLALIDEGDARRLAEAILRAERVYLAGLGRSGLVASCFAMRLVHLGFTA
ncbi:MAG: 6-phospho-3-hexuloisomerase, partial [Planctomycetota bacterium]